MQPTASQQRYLRALADRSGTTFTAPTTRAQASQLIEELRRRPRSSPSDRAIERAEAKRQAPQSAASVRRDEVTGYGSGARWARQ
jgi:hypothetical protein